VAKYIVAGTVTISVMIEVETDNTEAEARKIAEDSPMMTLCHHCAGRSPSGEWVTSGDLDGMPVIESVRVNR
jgi:hypothetical protein